MNNYQKVFVVFFSIKVIGVRGLYRAKKKNFPCLNILIPIVLNNFTSRKDSCSPYKNRSYPGIDRYSEIFLEGK